MKYFVNKAHLNIIGDLTQKYLLKDLRGKYKNYFTIFTPLAIAWGLLGLILALVTNNYQQMDLDINIFFFSNFLLSWIIVSSVLLGLISVLIWFEKVHLPSTINDLSRSRSTLLMLLIVVFGIIGATIYLSIPTIGIVILVLLSIPALISSWFAGKFYAVFIIRQYFRIRGWDYLEGIYFGFSIKGIITRISGLVGFILGMFAPLIAINSFVSIFFPKPVQEKGGVLGLYLENLIPAEIQLVLVFILILGPLISLAIQPSSFLELTLNSELYHTLSNFDWEEFNRKSDKIKKSISLKAYNKKTMAGILLIFFSFILYVTILAIGGIIKSNNPQIHIGMELLSNSLKFIEIPIFLIVLIRLFWDLGEEREIFDIANLGYKERRDITGWMFWILQSLYENDFASIEQNLDQLLEKPISSKNHRIYFYKGLVAALQGDNKKAEKNLTKAVTLKNSFADGWMELGLVMYYQGRYEEALMALLRAAKLKSRSKIILYNLGRVFDVLSREDEAVKIYEKAISIDSRDAKIWASLGKVLIEIGDLKRGIEATKEALKLDPEEYIAKLSLSIALLKSGEHVKYLEMVEVLLDQHKNSIRVKRVIEKSKKKTINYMENGLINSISYQTRYNYASCLEMAGEEESALIQYNLALKNATKQNDKVIAKKIKKKMAKLI